MSELFESAKTFTAGEHLEIIKSAIDDVQQTEEIRKKQSDEFRAILRDLSRKLAAAKKQATRSDDQLSAEEHQQQMTDLDNKNRVLKKSINKLDNDITAHQERLQLLQDELERLKNANVEDTIQPRDSNIALQLLLYRQLGLTFLEDSNGNYMRAIVSNRLKMYELLCSILATLNIF
ncbi:83_t:CDS:2 [Paraglomus occultum]|uniref:Kinetochore protein Spc24 n=1 Tax=Paraglomus occultum TaxID=144539 RepID=A0A9N8WJP9_9GLOM|nr:83_t:CDS:2 [Paraglomus occultum]